MSKGCSHMSHIKDVRPHTKGCEECLKMGDTWCICGYAGSAAT
jgi:hypothetical protein